VTKTGLSGTSIAVAFGEYNNIEDRILTQMMNFFTLPPEKANIS
jgi:hypothetical protein